MRSGTTVSLVSVSGTPYIYIYIYTTITIIIIIILTYLTSVNIRSKIRVKESSKNCPMLIKWIKKYNFRNIFQA